MEERVREPEQFSYREAKHRLRSIRWMLFWIAAVQTGVTVVMALITSFFSVPPPFWLQILLIELLAYLLPLSLYARENRLLTARTARERFGLRPCSDRLWPFVILGGIGCQFVMILVNLPVNLLLAEGESVIPETIPELLAALVVVAAVPALFEEFLFRGIVYGVMKELNEKAALIFTTVMFALMHGSVTGFLGYLFLGWATVMVLKRTGSLYACMAFHLINNGAALLLSWFSPRLLAFPMATIWLFLGGVLQAAAAFWGLSRMSLEKPVKPRIKTSDLLGQSFTSIPVILCVLCIIGVWVLQ